MAEVEGMGPRSVLPHIHAPGATFRASASNPVALVSTHAASVPPVHPTSSIKAMKKPSVASSGKPFSVEREEGIKEDPSADLRQKRRKRKVSEASAEEAALGVETLWPSRWLCHQVLRVALLRRSLSHLTSRPHFNGPGQHPSGEI
ncbi:hypothetical protein PIB30_046393 [Stylosanthes scabra]|uniref:Uncharacterized protein n=1 Tax=Stylosanthes scabra TaxID=79078 RepID=A0ABU6RH00_9FABA|nr:hypothetical protein [Stylosanthes scabra]